MPIRGQPWYNRLWMSAVNAVAPGRVFDTNQSGGVGNAYAMGDYKQAQLGNPWARARIAAGALPGLLGGAGETIVDQLQNRAINNYENSPDFMGAPRNYNAQGSLPSGMTQYGDGTYENPYSYGYTNPADVGPPAPNESRSNAPMPVFNPKTGGIRGYTPGGFSGTVNPNDPVGMSLLMGSLGFSSALGGGLGPDANAHQRPLVR